MTNDSSDLPPNGPINMLRESLKNLTQLNRVFNFNFKSIFLYLERKYQINERFALYLLFLIVIVFIPWISEASANQQLYSELKKFSEPLDPVKAGEMTESLSKYTPGLDEKAEDVVISRLLENDNYTLTQQLAINADKNFAVPDRVDATYTVLGGETIAQIAAKFDLHVATILDANNIKPENSKLIKPGTVLNIPSSDTSTSSDWIAQANAAEEAAKQAEAKKIAEANKKKQLAKLATSKQTASGFDGQDGGGLSFPLASSKGRSQSYGRGHTGVDFMANVGTPVYAAASGKVVIISTGWSGGYGNQVVVDHGGGRATRYAHLSSIATSAGLKVGRGEIIGYSGNTGRSTGPHLHFELIINGRPTNPGL